MDYHIRDEIFACTRECERLLSSEMTLTENERSFLGYYLNEVSRRFLSATPSEQQSPPPLEHSTHCSRPEV